MLGQLPTTLNVCGTDYKIRSDFRNILQIFLAFDDAELTDQDKVIICLQRMYVDYKMLPPAHYEAAYKAACAFIECGSQQDSPGPRTLNWGKDEQLIFPAVNKAAGMEVRSIPYLHWWTFLGYFQSIDRDDLLGQVLVIRQKRAKGKKLEKHEQEFFRSNKRLCSLDIQEKPKTTEQTMEDIFNSLLSEGGEE